MDAEVIATRGGSVSLVVNAGGDGIDSNGAIAIAGGTIVVSGSEGNTNGAQDYNGTAVISGGTVFAAGASGMVENFSDTSTQAAFMVSLTGSSGETVVSDAAGNVILTAEVDKNFQALVVSSPDLIVGETYTVTSGENTAEVSLTDIVTGSDVGSMMRGIGGMGGPNREKNPEVKDEE